MKRLAVLVFAVLGAMPFALGQGTPAPAPEIQDTDASPFHIALINYKTGNYDKARRAIDAAEQEKPGDFSVELLKARILTELKEYDAGEKILRTLLAGNTAPAATAHSAADIQLALGDLLLRKHSFERATKYYELALQAKPNDADIILKLVYARVGGSDLVGAGKYASQLSPMDPKNPYDDHASYYFARAALAQATGNTQGADDDIQTARTIYGITVSNHYLRTYLQVFAASEKNTDATPAPLVKPAPTGLQQ